MPDKPVAAARCCRRDGAGTPVSAWVYDLPEVPVSRIIVRRTQTLTQMNDIENTRTGQPPPARGFWPKALGWILMVGTVGVVSCQALFNL